MTDSSLELVAIIVLQALALAGMALAMHLAGRTLRNRKRGTWLPREWARKIAATSSRTCTRRT